MSVDYRCHPRSVVAYSDVDGVAHDKKKPSCWHKVVVVDKHSFFLCKTTYSDREITQLQVDIAEHKK